MPRVASSILDVVVWPAAGSIVPQQGLLLACLATPGNAPRNLARQRVRTAAAEILGVHLGGSAIEIGVHSMPGERPRLNRDDRPDISIGLSFSHEPGLSLVAISLDGAVGVDVLRVPDNPDWQADIPLLARDYLGPDCAKALTALPAHAQTQCFAERWTELEARLKCLGKGLQEWSPTLQQDLDACDCLRLRLPIGYCGAVARMPGFVASANRRQNESSLVASGISE